MQAPPTTSVSAKATIRAPPGRNLVPTGCGTRDSSPPTRRNSHPKWSASGSPRLRRTGYLGLRFGRWKQSQWGIGHQPKVGAPAPTLGANGNNANGVVADAMLEATTALRLGMFGGR